MNPRYSKEAVDACIRRDPRIGKREAAKIHALLRGHDTPAPATTTEPEDKS